MTDLEVLIQQLISGLSNGMIIALIAIGYTLVYGIVELINFAHGDVVMLGGFFALTLIDPTFVANPSTGTFVLLVIGAGMFCGLINLLVDRFFYLPIRRSPRISQLVTAIGVSFVLMNIGLLWGLVPLESFGMGVAPASPKDFPSLLPTDNLLGESSVQISYRDLAVVGVTIPLLLLLSAFVKYTRWGVAMRAVAQNPDAAKLMGINVHRIVGLAFFIGGALGGVASVVYAVFNNTVYFQMGYRIGLDGFTAAVLGGIGNLTGAVIGGILIGVIRALSDQYIATRWTGVVVFSILVLVLVFRPTGLLGSRVREKV